jgi:hypothetical protein
MFDASRRPEIGSLMHAPVSAVTGQDNAMIAIADR